MDLHRKSAVITGASSGLGLAIAKELLKKNSVVHALGRDKEKLETVRQEISSANLHIHQVDIRDFSQIERSIAKIEKVDILINNAGLWIEGSLQDNPFVKISDVIDTNLKGLIYTTKVVLPKMLAQDNGFILNISSTSGIRGKKEQSVYVASKFGITGFTKSLYLDLEKTNVKVAGFYPGGMKTSFFEKAGSSRQTDKFMDTDKVAEVVIFILERDNTMVLDEVILDRRL
ncbi:MAG: SDR family oxidoreductase [Candidatus Woesebacteria bacterium]|jgi:short-subunit dehydrogenase